MSIVFRKLQVSWLEYFRYSILWRESSLWVLSQLGWGFRKGIYIWNDGLVIFVQNITSFVCGNIEWTTFCDQKVELIVLCLCPNKHLIYINNSLHLTRKYACIFFRGHYVLQEENCFPEEKLVENYETWPKWAELKFLVSLFCSVVGWSSDSNWIFLKSSTSCSDSK